MTVPCRYPLDTHPRGYLCVLAAFLVQFVIFGMQAAFPVFIHAFKHDETLGKPTTAQISLVSSLSNGPGLLFGVLGGVALDKFGPRPLLAFITFLLAFSLIVPSFVAHSYLALIALYSLPATITVGMANSPISAAVGSWYDKRLSVMMGLATMGGGIGSAVLPTVAGNLVGKIGWRATWRYLALFDLLMATATVLCSKRPLEPAEGLLMDKDRAGAEEDTTARRENPSEETGLLNSSQATTAGPLPPAAVPSTELKPSLCTDMRNAWRYILSRPFLTLVAAGICFGFCYTAALFIIIPIADAYGKKGSYKSYATISEAAASSLFIWFGGAQAVGSIVFGVAGYILNPKRCYCISSLLVAAGFLCMMFSRTYIELGASYCLVGGAFAGLWSMFPSMVTEHFAGPQLGTMMGLSYVPIGIGALIGPPAVTLGANLTGGDEYYLSLGACAGIAVFGCALTFFLMPKPPTHDAEDDDVAVLLQEE